MEYSSSNIPLETKHVIVDRMLGELLGEIEITRVTLAYSQPKNIKDLITKAKLHQPPGKETSKYYAGSRPLFSGKLPQIDQFAPYLAFGLPLAQREQFLNS